LEYLINSSSEDNYLDMIDRKRFYEKLLKNKINGNPVSDLFKKKEISSIEKEKFNALLKKLKKLYDINIFETLLYFEQDYSDMMKLISLLDATTKQILKEELSKKYHKKLLKTKLDRFLG
jgi:hypothetical protein